MGYETVNAVGAICQRPLASLGINFYGTLALSCVNYYLILQQQHKNDDVIAGYTDNNESSIFLKYVTDSTPNYQNDTKCIAFFANIKLTQRIAS